MVDVDFTALADGLAKAIGMWEARKCTTLPGFVWHRENWKQMIPVATELLVEAGVAEFAQGAYNRGVRHGLVQTIEQPVYDPAGQTIDYSPLAILRSRSVF